MSKIRLGIIGYGNMGSGHTKNIFKGKCPEIALTAIADINPERLELARQLAAEMNMPCPPLFDDASKMMDSGLCDAILVAVPHYDHARYVIEALEKGLHAMSEKPAGVYTKQVREMIAVADQHPELTFGMMFNQRTNCVYRKMREILQSGELGQIRRTSWIITNWYRPQS